MRLHPVKDGVIPFDPADRRPVATRDHFGQKLVDHTDQNGFCTGAWSNMTHGSDASVFPGGTVSGMPSATCPNIQTTVAPNGALVYYDPAQVIVTDDGTTWALAMRTSEMGDGPLPVSRVRVAERTVDSDLEDILIKDALKRIGFKGRLTPGMRAAVLKMIQLEITEQAGTDNRPM